MERNDLPHQLIPKYNDLPHQLIPKHKYRSHYQDINRNLTLMLNRHFKLHRRRRRTSRKSS